MVHLGKGNFYQPLGSLGDIFKNTISGSVFFGNRTNKWEWEGKLEYLKFEKNNDEKLFYSGAGHTLEIGGIGFNANYLLFSPENTFIPKVTFGAGIYRWIYKRNDVLDSLQSVITRKFSHRIGVVELTLA